MIESFTKCHERRDTSDTICVRQGNGEKFMESQREEITLTFVLKDRSGFSPLAKWGGLFVAETQCV